jgi:hypothetical protein
LTLCCVYSAFIGLFFNFNVACGGGATDISDGPKNVKRNFSKKYQLSRWKLLAHAFTIITQHLSYIKNIVCVSRLVVHKYASDG